MVRLAYQSAWLSDEGTRARYPGPAQHIVRGVAQGGQVYIYRTTDGNELNNQFVTVIGTAYDVAYMDAKSDENNTVY